ncbi:MAG: cysteine desulfurase [Nanoarchaeota archaeon]
MNIENIRKDFPVLQKKSNGKPVIYFDNACVSLRPVQVIEAMNEYYKEYPACVSRSVHKLGAKATEKYNEARRTIAKFINAGENEVIFTRNTTEGINLIANSLGLKKDDAVVTSDKEHNSNLLPWQILSQRTGIKHKICRTNDDGTFNIENFTREVRGARLVSVVHASNLDGYTNPVEEITKTSHENNALVLLDAAQSTPHKKIDVKKLDVDFLAFSGHKMLGPSGIGILYGKAKLLRKLKHFIVGGDTVEDSTYTTADYLDIPEKFEAGLQNYAGAIGLSAAVNYLSKIGLDNIAEHENELNKYITKEIEDFAEILGPEAGLRTSIISFNIKGIDPHEIAIILDNAANIMVRSGMHCVHSWFNNRKIKGSARASLYLYNTKEEAKIFIENLRRINKLK